MKLLLSGQCSVGKEWTNRTRRLDSPETDPHEIVTPLWQGNQDNSAGFGAYEREEGVCRNSTLSAQLLGKLIFSL